MVKQGEKALLRRGDAGEEQGHPAKALEKPQAHRSARARYDPSQEEEGQKPERAPGRHPPEQGDAGEQRARRVGKPVFLWSHGMHLLRKSVSVHTYGPRGPAMPRREYGKAEWIHIRFYRETQVALFCKQEGMGPDFIKFRKPHSRGEKKRGVSPLIRPQSQDMPLSLWKMGISWGGDRWP